MAALLASERLKAWSTAAWWKLALGAVVVAAMPSYGYVLQIEEAGRAVTAADGTRSIVEIWFTTSLFAALLGSQLVTREYKTGAVARSTLLAGGRGRLVAAKTVVSLEFGLAYALASVLLAVATAAVLLPWSGSSFAWSGEATLTALGVIAVVTMSGPWGVFIGWVCRNTAVAVGVLLVVTLMVDEALFAALPAVGRFTFTKAQSSIYLDGDPGLLPVWAAVVVVTLWLAALGAVASRLYGRRDLT